jgi:hypothetical protein
MKFFPQTVYELESYLKKEQIEQNFNQQVQKPTSFCNVYKYLDDDQQYEGELVDDEFWIKSLQDFIRVKGSIREGHPNRISLRFLNYPRPFRNISLGSGVIFRGPVVLILGFAIGFALFALFCEGFVLVTQKRFSLSALIPLAISAFCFTWWKVVVELRFKHHLSYIRRLFVEKS